MKKPAVHNTHLLLPEALWKKASATATSEGSNFTAMVVEGLHLALEKRRKESK